MATLTFAVSRTNKNAIVVDKSRLPAHILEACTNYGIIQKLRDSAADSKKYPDTEARIKETLERLYAGIWSDRGSSQSPDAVAMAAATWAKAAGRDKEAATAIAAAYHDEAHEKHEAAKRILKPFVDQILAAREEEF